MQQPFEGWVRTQAITSLVSNTVLVGAFVWLLNREKETIAASGAAGFAVDLAITGFGLTAILAALAAYMTRHAVASGKLADPRRGGRASAAVGWVSSRPMSATAQLALASVLVFAPATVGLLVLAGVESMPVVAYAVFKGVWSGVLAAVVVFATATAVARDVAPLGQQQRGRALA